MPVNAFSRAGRPDSTTSMGTLRYLKEDDIASFSSEMPAREIKENTLHLMMSGQCWSQMTEHIGTKPCIVLAWAKKTVCPKPQTGAPLVKQHLSSWYDDAAYRPKQYWKDTNEPITW